VLYTLLCQIFLLTTYFSLLHYTVQIHPPGGIFFIVGLAVITNVGLAYLHFAWIQTSLHALAFSCVVGVVAGVVFAFEGLAKKLAS
jgi:hypothetical protein